VKNYGIIFDLDDTLLATSNLYYSLIIEMMAMVESCSSPSFLAPEKILNVYRIVTSNKTSVECETYYEEMDIENMDVYPDRFPRYLAETFIESCLQAGVFPKKEDVQRVYDVGTKIFSHTYRLVPGAMRLLQYLFSRKDVRLFIVTHGSEKLQAPKMRDKERTFSRFDRIVVVPSSISKSVAIKELIEKNDNIDEWVMVGDSITKDINPALAVGIRAILVRKHMSHIAEGEVVDIGDTRKRFVDIDDMGDLYEYMKERYLPKPSERTV